MENMYLVSPQVGWVSWINDTSILTLSLPSDAMMKSESYKLGVMLSVRLLQITWSTFT
jgi:hypothetical protein